MLQCWDRVQRYLEEPVNVNVRITHNDSLEYPAITVCNKNIFNRTAALELMVQHKVVTSHLTSLNCHSILWEIVVPELKKIIYLYRHKNVKSDQ